MWVDRCILRTSIVKLVILSSLDPGGTHIPQIDDALLTRARLSELLAINNVWFVSQIQKPTHS